LGDSEIHKISQAPKSADKAEGKSAVSTLSALDVSSMEMVNCHILVPRFLAQSWAYGWKSDHKLVLVGSTPSLGSWDASKGVPLSLTSLDKGKSYSAEVMLPLGVPVNAKIVAISSKGVEEWEGGENRSFTLHPPSSTNQGSDSGGGFLVMLHHGDGSNSSQVTYFPPFPAIDESQAVKLSTKALCRFTVPHKVTQVGEYLILVGSLPQLGAWNPEKGVQLTSRGNNVWSTDLILPSDVAKRSMLFLNQDSTDLSIFKTLLRGIIHMR
jgi:Starch binding domain